MKLNFWQIFGAILLIVGVIVFARRKTADVPVSPATGAPVTTPATSLQ